MTRIIVKIGPDLEKIEEDPGQDQEREVGDLEADPVAGVTDMIPLRQHFPPPSI